MLFEFDVRLLDDGGDDRRAEIDRDPIGLLMIQRGYHAFTRLHRFKS